MILAIDIGNTNIVLGCVDDTQICVTERIATDKRKTDAEYAIIIKQITDLHNMKKEDFEGVIISSVVPQLTMVIEEAVKKLFDSLKIISVGPGIKTGVNILLDDPAQLGSNILVAAAATLEEHKTPIILIDFGTATTVSVLKGKSQFCGGMILPGVRTSLDSLVSETALLKEISLDAPRNVIGRNTAECMKNGIIFGNAAATDGIIERIEAEIGEKCTVVATGDMAGVIVPYCHYDIIQDDTLLLKGLKIIYDKNRK